MEFGDSNLSFLMLISFLKDDFPWIYEVGLDTYHGLKLVKSLNERRKLILNFEKAFEMLRNPMMMEYFGRSEEMYIFTNELRSIIHHYLDRLMMSEEKLKVKYYE